MFVRVFDKEKNIYYKSMVYAMVGTGWFLQYIVLNPHTQKFELVDYLEKDAFCDLLLKSNKDNK